MILLKGRGYIRSNKYNVVRQRFFFLLLMRGPNTSFLVYELEGLDCCFFEKFEYFKEVFFESGVILNNRTIRDV